MAGVIVDPLTNGSVLERQVGIQRVFASRLNMVRKLSRPARVKPAGAGRAGVVANLFVQSNLAIDRADLAQVVAQNVGVVDAGVDHDRAGLLHLAPRRDGDSVSTADVGFDHQPWRANRSGVDERAGQTIDRIAAIVFAYRHDPIRALRGVDDQLAAAHSEREWLL